MNQLATVRLLLLLSLGLIATIAIATEQTNFPAFPEAQGFGAYTIGGRGGKVLLVTTLADYDPRKDSPVPGSLRMALETDGPRTILFRMTGYIDLKAELRITKPFVTIAGQTAPGGGICLRSNTLMIATDQVILRHLRVRGATLDAISVSNARRVIIDHCSASYGADEVLSLTGENHDITVSSCMISDGLLPHSKGSIVGANGGVSLLNNIWAHFDDRTPLLAGIGGGNAVADCRNNVIYDWGKIAAHTFAFKVRINFVGNYFKPGPTTARRLAAGANPDIFRAASHQTRLYLEGNVVEDNATKTTDNWRMVGPWADWKPMDIKKETQTGEHPAPRPPLLTAQQAYELALRDCGAVLPRRDSVDERVIKEIRTGTGAIIASVEQVGGWPEYPPAQPSADRDLDGMPDGWEITNGLNSANATDHSGDLDQDGYTNLEEFLNSTDPRKPTEWITPPRIQPEHNSIFTAATSCTITSSVPGAIIRYTLDGSEPNLSSPKYETPFTIRHSTAVRAIACVSGRASRPSFAEIVIAQLRPPESPKLTAPGLAYAYYEGPFKKDPKHPDAMQQFYQPARMGVGTKAFDQSPRARADDYCFEFTGFIAVPRDGLYHFYLNANRMGRLYIGGEELIMSRTEVAEEEGRIALKAGKHSLRLTYLRQKAIADPGLEIAWKVPDLSRVPVPFTALFHEVR
jgi:hypothetical protein